MLTAPVVQCPNWSVASLMPLKALVLLKQNIRTLLAARKEDQVSLAQYVGHSKAWINKFLSHNEPDAEIQLKDLDRIADFFGIATYQLFQPGISMLTERRTSADRRTGLDRRIGHSARMLPGLRAELNKMPRLASRGADHGPGAIPSVVAAIIAKAEREIADYYASTTSGGQTPGARKSVAGPSKNR